MATSNNTEDAEFKKKVNEVYAQMNSAGNGYQNRGRGVGVIRGRLNNNRGGNPNYRGSYNFGNRSMEMGMGSGRRGRILGGAPSGEVGTYSPSRTFYNYRGRSRGSVRGGMQRSNSLTNISTRNFDQDTRLCRYCEKPGHLENMCYAKKNDMKKNKECMACEGECCCPPLGTVCIPITRVDGDQTKVVMASITFSEEMTNEQLKKIRGNQLVMPSSSIKGESQGRIFCKLKLTAMQREMCCVLLGRDSILQTIPLEKINKNNEKMLYQFANHESVGYLLMTPIFSEEKTETDKFEQAVFDIDGSKCIITKVKEDDKKKWKEMEPADQVTMLAELITSKVKIEK